MPGIHVLPAVKKEEAGTSPAMTEKEKLGPSRSGSHDSRISNKRRPSFFSNFFTALDAATSPWLA
jgi:hypothetical protein